MNKLAIKPTNYILSFLILLISSCGSLQTKLQPATSIKNGSVKNFKYIFITPTKTLTSGTGSFVNGYYYSSEKSVNPSDLIAGTLIKNSFIKLPELKSDLLKETLIVNYGESGRRNTGLGGYSIEVTIQFISASSNELICSCTAEGQGTTEADDIRIAINRCLNEILAPPAEFK